MLSNKGLPAWRRFFLYFVIMFLVNQTSMTIFRAVAAIGRAVVLCNVIAFIYIAYSLMLCGFIVTHGARPSNPVAQSHGCMKNKS